MIQFATLRARLTLAAALGLAAAPALPAQAPDSAQETRLLRFPHIHESTVVFTYAGDLYTVPLSGGTARRLTSHDGLELFARFSPDGRWIAFSGEYAGTRQVYLIPAEGGTPRQLTYYPDVGPMPPRGGYDHLVLDWTPDGSKILIRANRTPFGERVGRYYLVDPWNGGLETPLQIPEGASGATFDPTGNRLAYNIKSREWRHWKRYEGGRQQDVWVYDLAADTSRRVTDYTGTDNFPLWVGDEVFFVSDRDARRKLNLWVHDTRGGEPRQVTTHMEYDVLWPSRGAGGIVYENGGHLWHLDPATRRSRRIPVVVPGDWPLAMPYHTNVRERIESFSLSPNARRALFVARGEIFTAPAKHGDIRNFSGTERAREMSAAWSPDGRWIAYLSDAQDEYDVYVRAADGSGEPRRLLRGGDAWIFGLAWSPDSRRIALMDNRNRLRALDVESGRVTEIDRGTHGPLLDFSWSPDSRWLTYAKTAPNTMSSVWLYSFDSGRSAQVTGNETNESSPVFDRNGRYLYFVSARDFNYGDRDFDARIFVATLRRDEPHPFPPRSDEEAPAAQAGGNGAKGESGEAGGASAALRIDLDGLGTRVAALPGLRPGSYGNLTGLKDGVAFVSNDSLQRYDVAEREAKTVLEGVTHYSLSREQDKVLYRRRSDYGIVPFRAGQKNDAGRIALESMTLRIDPRVEWAQIYTDAWRIMRDWFYDPALHRVDWDAMRRRYEPLVAHVAHRADLDHVLAELVGELNAGHAYVNSAPGMPGPERVDVGLLGAELTADGERYRIATIYPGENWHEKFRSPLTEPGVDVRAGDYLLAIDGQPVTTRDNPYRFLVGNAERVVELTVSARADGASARTYKVRPVKSELGLLYQQWAADNARLVDSLSNGRIGYIHLPNTAVPGFRELYEGFQPQHLKEALIIDDRYNDGGFIPQEMVSMLAQPILNYWSKRNSDLFSTPFVAHTGPKAMLINGQSGSGGDAIAYYFRKLGLGPLVGERTWGGLIGLMGNPALVDGGSIAVPVFAFVDAEGNWAVEGVGVGPDIEVLDRPEQIAAGREPMIERAVQHLLEELERPQYRRPDTPAGPVRRPPQP